MAYDEAYYKSRETWRDWRIEARELMRAVQIHPNSRVLEIGCGSGGLMRMLRERGVRVVGVDTLDMALKLARKQFREDGRTRLVRVGKDGALPFCDSVFDAIIGQHVIEHLPDVNAALREWHRLLKGDGELVLATPNALYPDPSHFADLDHTHIFSPPELRTAVQQAGFAIQSCFMIFPFLTRSRAWRAVGVMAYNLFRHAPYFSQRGRTIVLAAKKK